MRGQYSGRRCHLAGRAAPDAPQLQMLARLQPSPIGRRQNAATVTKKRMIQMATPKLFSFSILAASALAISTPAMADVKAKEVHHADLDLASDKGQERLKTRVKSAVRQICASPRAIHAERKARPITLRKRRDGTCDAQGRAGNRRLSAKPRFGGTRQHGYRRQLIAIAKDKRLRDAALRSRFIFRLDLLRRPDICAQSASTNLHPAAHAIRRHLHGEGR